MRLPRLTTRQRWMVAVSMVAILYAAAFLARRPRAANRDAERQELLVKDLLKDEPVASIGLRMSREVFTGTLSRLGLEGPSARRGEQALMRINPIDPLKGPTKTVGQTIDACRKESDVELTEVLLSRRIPAPDPMTRLGPYSARSRGEFGMVKNIEFYTYGNLDVGIKDGAIVAVQVR